MGEARRKLKALENTPVKIQIGRSVDGKVVRVQLDRLARYIDFDPDSAVRFAQHLVMVAKPLPGGGAGAPSGNAQRQDPAATYSPGEGGNDESDTARLSDGIGGLCGDAGGGQGVVADAAPGREVRPDVDPA